MANGQRNGVRESIKDLLTEALPDWKVFNGRITDARKTPQYVEIYFAAGSTESVGTYAFCQAQLVLAIAKAETTNLDQELDAVGDICTKALEADRTLGQTVSGITPQGFEYPNESEAQHDKLLLRFTVTLP